MTKVSHSPAACTRGLAAYDVWLVGRIVALLRRHDRRVLRERIRRRTSEVMRQRQARGQRMSQEPPYGWQVDPRDPSRLTEVPAEQAVYRWIVEAWGGGRSLREIARRLEAAGLPCRGRRWFHSTIRRILRRAGKRVGESA
jgi:hypothetical protein